MKHGVRGILIKGGIRDIESDKSYHSLLHGLAGGENIGDKFKGSEIFLAVFILVINRVSNEIQPRH